MYELRGVIPDAETFVSLREAAGMAPRTLAAARRGLSNSVYSVVAREDGSGVADDQEAGPEDGEQAGACGHNVSRAGAIVDLVTVNVSAKSLEVPPAYPEQRPPPSRR